MMLNRRFGSALSVALVTSVLAAPITSTAARPATQSPANEHQLTVVRRQQISFDGRRIIGFGPSGRWFLVSDQHQLCAIDAELLVDHACAALPFRSPIDEYSLAWSPEGDRVAMTENSAVVQRDSDLYVFDLPTGVLTNLTDDGSEASLFPTDDLTESLWADASPVWSPDGMSIAFGRTFFSANSSLGYPTTPQIIPANSGAPESLGIVSSFPFAVYGGVRWSPDGEHLVYVIGAPNFDDPDNGLWTLDLSDGRLSYLMDTAGVDIGIPMLSQFTPNGDAILYYPVLAAVDEPDFPFRIFNLETGEVESFVPADDIAPSKPASLVISPDGQNVLYAAADGRVILHDRATGRETNLLATLPDARVDILTLTWATNNTVYASSSPERGVLLELETRN